jgi:hypothetical protein
MSDFNSALPIRTEQDGDVVVKIADATVPSQQLTINPDGSVNVTDNGGSLTVDGTVELGATTLAALESITVQNGAGGAAVNIQDGGNSITVDAVDLDIRDLAFATDKVDVTGSDVTATVTATDLDIRDLVFATDKVDVSGSEVSLDAATLAALETITVEQGTSPWVVSATDLDIRNLTHVSDSVKIGDGTDFLAVNTDGSINVVVQEDVGTEVVDYDTAAAIAGGATSNHDQVFASASKLYQILATASGKLKIEVQVEDGAASDVFNTIAVGFNSTANPNIDIALAKYAAIPAGARVRIIRTNKDAQAQDVYSTIVAILG